MAPPLPMPSDSSPSLVDATLDNTLGATFIGLVVASILFGISCLQAYIYYHHWQHDALVHRLAVGILWILDALHLALTCHAVYYYSITSFGLFENLLHVVWSIKLQITINVLIVVLVQFLYAYRVWLLSGYHRGILGYVAVAAVTGGFVIGVVLAKKIYDLDMFMELSSAAWIINAALATATTIDFVLAGAMCFYLTKSKGQELLLNSRISRVMQYTLSSGLFTSACSLSALFTHVFLPNTMIFYAIESLLTIIYVVSFFAMLNARERGRSDEVDFSQASSTSTLTMPRFATPKHRVSKRTSSTRELMTASSPTLQRSTSRFGDGSRTPSFYSHYAEVSPTSPECLTSFPIPDPVKLPRTRTTRSLSTISHAASQNQAEKWW